MERTSPHFNPNRESAEHSVEFYPAVEDHVHIAQRIGGSIKQKRSALWAYWGFLLVNVIAFPAFLLFEQYIWAAAFIFVLNAALVLLIMPRVEGDSLTEYYSQVFGNRVRVPARVDLTDEGIHYSADGAECYWPWGRISGVEETESSIYFYFDGNGFAVRKSGFAYHDDARSFFEYAESRFDRTRHRSLTE